MNPELYIVANRTQTNAREVCWHMAKALRTEVGFFPKPTTLAILLAQSALESGHWKSCWNWNLGNVKASDRWGGHFTCIKLNEVLRGRGTVWFAPEGELSSKDGELVGVRYAVPPGHPQTRMRAFQELAAAVTDHVRFLFVDTTPLDGRPNRYQKAADAAIAGYAATFAHELKVAGYYTANEESYTRAVISLTDKFITTARSLDSNRDGYVDELDEPVWLTDEQWRAAARDTVASMRVEPSNDLLEAAA